MVCAPCMVMPLVAGGTGITAYFRKNKKMMIAGITLILLGIISYRQQNDKKSCKTCNLN